MENITSDKIICFSDVEQKADLEKLRSYGINEADIFPEERDDEDSEWIIYKTLAAHGREGTTLPQIQSRQRHYEPDVLDNEPINNDLETKAMDPQVVSWLMGLSNSEFENLLSSWKMDISHEEGTVSNEAFDFLTFMNGEYRSMQNSKAKFAKENALPFLPEEKIRSATRYFHLRKEKKEQSIEDSVREQMNMESQRGVSDFPFDETISPFNRAFYVSIDRRKAGALYAKQNPEERAKKTAEHAFTAKEAKMYFMLNALKEKHGHYPVESVDKYLASKARESDIDFGSEVIGRALKQGYITNEPFLKMDGSGYFHDYVLSIDGQKFLSSYDPRIVAQYAVRLSSQTATKQETDELFRKTKIHSTANQEAQPSILPDEQKDSEGPAVIKSMRHHPLMEVHQAYQVSEVKNTPYGIRYAMGVERPQDRHAFFGNRR